MFKQLNIFLSIMNPITLSLSKCDKLIKVSLRQAQTDKVLTIIQTWTLFLVLLFIMSDLSFAVNVDEQMQQAGEYYRSGQFESAINIYEEIRSEGYEGTSLYFNVANSYYRIGKLGEAILNYERALKLSPNDEDVKHNLAFANLSTIDRIQPLPTFFLFQWWESILATLTVNEWTYLAYFIFVLLIVLVVVYFFAKTIFQQKLILFSGLGMLTAFLLVTSLLIVKVNKEENVIEGVIIEQSLTVKTSPDMKSTDAFVIHEGLKVNLEDKLDNWIKVRLADGKVGWIENNAVVKI